MQGLFVGGRGFSSSLILVSRSLCSLLSRAPGRVMRVSKSILIPLSRGCCCPKVVCGGGGIFMFFLIHQALFVGGQVFSSLLIHIS